MFATSNLNTSLPKNSFKSSDFIVTALILGDITFFLATFLHIVEIFCSKALTPDSLVKLVIIFFITSSLILIKSGLKLCSFSCLGSKYLFAISNFSISVYPLSDIISILSSRGLGMVSRVFAVVINITFDKSNSYSR